MMTRKYSVWNWSRNQQANWHEHTMRSQTEDFCLYAIIHGPRPCYCIKVILK